MTESTAQREEESRKEHVGWTISRPLVYALLAMVVVGLGLNWPIMAIGLESITPIWMGVFRVIGAAVVLLVIGAVSGNLAIPPKRDLPIILSLSVFRLAVVMVLVFTALTLVPAGKSSVLVWTSSLWTVPIAAIFLGEHMTRGRWVGLTIGITGVILLASPWANDWTDPGVALGTALLLIAAVVLASTSVHIRRHHWTIAPMAAMPWQMLLASIPLVTLGLVVDGVPQIEWTTQLAWVVIYQGVMGTGLAFWAQIVVLRNASAVSTNLTLMGVPVVGVISSAIVLDESITASLAIGMALVIAGVAVNLLNDPKSEPVGLGTR